MSRAKDVEVTLPGIKPKEHPVRLRGRISRYPFKLMLLGDYFRMETAGDAARARSAASLYSQRHPAVKFTVRLDATGSEWYCRRVM